MNNYKQIFVCSDLFATSDSEQLSNLAWLHDVLKNPLMRTTGVAPQAFSANESIGFSRKKFFALSDIELDLSVLQFHFDASTINQGSIDYFKEFVQEDSLLIGYELSEHTRQVLTSYEFTYIDMWLHPIRYMDDILFGFGSNNKDIFNALVCFDYAKEHFELYADKYKVSTYKGYKRIAQNIQIRNNSALLVGQTSQDKSVLKNGKFLNLLDFKSEIMDLAETHSAVYFSRHPFASESDDKMIMKFLNGIENLFVSEAPVYGLLSKDELKTVAAISSSVVMEGEYFGKVPIYFHKPIFNLSKEHCLTSYVSVFQDFMYPQFWETVLAPIFKVNHSAPVEFYSKKNKVRDMLNFYWSYKHIDKLEAMSETLRAVDLKVQRISKSIDSVKKLSVDGKKTNSKTMEKNYTTVVKSDKRSWELVKTQIDSAEAISFDIFDTLLVRPFEDANDLFSYMESYVEEITAGKIMKGKFRYMREKSREWVKDSKCGEEVSLKERYEAIADKVGLTEKEKSAIYDLELSLEMSILRPREFVVRAFNYAKSQGKYIAVVSDTFFTKDFLIPILTKNRILDYDLLWLSSEVKLLKHTGNIYPKLIRKISLPANKILHIGDNKLSDIKQAKKHGINTLYIPRTVDEFKRRTSLVKALNYNDHLSKSIITGVIANKIMDNPMNYSYPSHSGGDIYNTGYSIVGPMFYGYAKWVLNKAVSKGVKNVFFLARDGEIIKKCYDLLCQNIKTPPKSEYLHVSRRVLNVASIFNESDIERVAALNFSSITIEQLLKNRFGLNDVFVDIKFIQKLGFQTINERINSNKHKQQFLKICLLLKDEIFKISTKERRDLLSYLKEKGLTGKEDTYVVDIGHNGTLQKSLNIILNSDCIDGLYFVTHSGIKQNITNSSLNASGYLGENINAKDKRYPYNKYILLFESCFLNKEGSTVSIEKNAQGEYKINQLSVENEFERVLFSDQLHKGVLDFVLDINKVAYKLKINLILSPRESANPFFALVTHPYELDLLLFNNVTFENIFSGRGRQALIHYNPFSKKESYEKSIWTDHLNVLNWSFDKNKGPSLHKIIYFFMVFLHRFGFISRGKFYKFKRNPIEFFEDSKVAVSKYFLKVYTGD